MPPVYTTRELSQESGMSPRTIKYYRRIGLVSGPYKRSSINEMGEYPVWGTEHLRQLRQIDEIRSNNRTLADIRDMMFPEEDDE